MRILSRGTRVHTEEGGKELKREPGKIAGTRKELEEREGLTRYRFWWWTLDNLDRMRSELDDPKLSARRAGWETGPVPVARDLDQTITLRSSAREASG